MALAAPGSGASKSTRLVGAGLELRLLDSGIVADKWHRLLDGHMAFELQVIDIDVQCTGGGVNVEQHAIKIGLSGIDISLELQSQDACLFGGKLGDGFDRKSLPSADIRVCGALNERSDRFPVVIRLARVDDPGEELNPWSF